MTVQEGPGAWPGQQDLEQAGNCRKAGGENRASVSEAGSQAVMTAGGRGVADKEEE